MALQVIPEWIVNLDDEDVSLDVYKRQLIRSPNDIKNHSHPILAQRKAE